MLLILLLIPLAYAAITSEIASERPNPYTLDKLQYYRIGPNQAASDLWRYRFAVPIIFHFKTHPFSDVRQSPHFHFDVLKEVYPLLLLPNFYGDKLGNPFKGVKEEHYDQSDCTVDLTVILAEIVSAYREKRDVNYAVLAEKFSLLGTMIAIEDYVCDFDSSMFGDQNADEVKAMVALRKKLDAMAVEVYRPAGADSKNAVKNGFLKDDASGSQIPTIYYELITGDERIWTMIKPHLKKKDKEELFELLSFRSPLPVSNADFLGEAINEASDLKFERGQAHVLPVDFFVENFKGNLRTFLNTYIVRVIYQRNPGLVHYYASLLTTNDASQIVNNPRNRYPMDVFLARRFLALAQRGGDTISLEVLQNLELPLRDIMDGIRKGVVSGDTASILTTYDGYLRSIQKPSNERAIIDVKYLALILEDFPDLELPKFDQVISSEFYPLNLKQEAVIFEKALASGNIALAKKVSSRDLFQYKNYCAKIADLDNKDAMEILSKCEYCLTDVLKRKPQFKVLWQTGWTADMPNYTLLASVNSFADLHLLSDSIIIHQIGEKEKSLFDAVLNTKPLFGRLKVNSLFLAQFGQIVPDLSSFQHLSLSTMAQIIFGSKTLKPHLYQFATELFKKTTSLSNRHEYFKLASLYFEVFPAAMEDDTQLASYLSFLLESIGAASDMQVDLPQENPFHREILKMDEHLFYILSNRVIKQEKAAFRGLLKRFNVKGTLVNIQLSETDQQLVEACDEYFANFFFNAEIMEDLLSVLESCKKALFIYCLERAAETWKEDWNVDEVQSFLLNVVPKHMEPSLELQKSKWKIMQILKGNRSYQPQGSKKEAAKKIRKPFIAV